MKYLILIAALATGVIVVPTAASADPGQATVTRTTVKTSASSSRSSDGPRWHTKRVCKVKWKHGRKWRQCRTVRTRW